jgi:hypothetical protein
MITTVTHIHVRTTHFPFDKLQLNILLDSAHLAAHLTHWKCPFPVIAVPVIVTVTSVRTSVGIAVGIASRGFY